MTDENGVLLGSVNFEGHTENRIKKLEVYGFDDDHVTRK